MSILSDANLDFPGILVAATLLLGTVFSLAMVVTLGPRLCRLRPAPTDSTSNLFFTLLGALGFLIVGTALGGSMMKHLDPEELRTQAAYSVGMIASIGGALLLDSLYRRDRLNSLGLSPRRLLPGIAAGVLWLVVILPWVYWVNLAVEMAIAHFHIQTPTMHEIFRIWDSPQGKSLGFRVIAVIAACVVAPFSEELLFRGLLQTLIVRLLAYRSPGVANTRRSLTAVFITAALFASIHRPWTIQPAIFVLAIGLGLAYEYLGNLWANITIHCLFNAVNFILFLKTH